MTTATTVANSKSQRKKKLMIDLDKVHVVMSEKRRSTQVNQQPHHSSQPFLESKSSNGYTSRKALGKPLHLMQTIVDDG